MLTRREVLAAFASSAALPLIGSCVRGDVSTPPMSNDPDALKLLDEVAGHLLQLQPESATSLGIDTGARAALRSALADRSEDGKQRVAKQVRADIDRVKAFNTNGLSSAVRTSIDVVRSAYATAL